MRTRRLSGAPGEPMRGQRHPGGRRPWKIRGLVKGPVKEVSCEQNDPSRCQTELCSDHLSVSDVLWPRVYAFLKLSSLLVSINQWY